MEKKTYIAPAIEELNIDAVEMIASSGNSLGIFNDEVESTTQRGAERRGVWGDRWE